MKTFRRFLQKLSRKNKEVPSGDHLLSLPQIKAEDKKLMNSPRNKLSAGAQERAQMIKNYGGWDSKVSGRERARNHKKAK